MTKKKSSKSSTAKKTKRRPTAAQMVRAVDAKLEALAGSTQEVTKQVDEQRHLTYSLSAAIVRLTKIVDSPDPTGSHMERRLDADETRITKLEEKQKLLFKGLYILLSALIGGLGIFITYFLQS